MRLLKFLLLVLAVVFFLALIFLNLGIDYGVNLEKGSCLSEDYCVEILSYDFPEEIVQSRANYVDISFKNVGNKALDFDDNIVLSAHNQLAGFDAKNYYLYSVLKPGDEFSYRFPVISNSDLFSIKGFFQFCDVSSDNCFGDKVIYYLPLVSDVVVNDLPVYDLRLSNDDIAHFEDFSKRSLDYGMILQDENVWRKAKLFYEDKSYDVKVKIHGDFYHHIRDPSYLSYKVRLLDGKSINGYTQFSFIQYPERNGSPHMFVNYVLSKMELFYFSHDLVNLSINEDGAKKYYFRPSHNSDWLETNSLSGSVLIEKDFVYDYKMLYSIDLSMHDSHYDFNIAYNKFESEAEFLDKAIYKYYALGKYLESYGWEDFFYYFFDENYILDFLSFHNAFYLSHDVLGDNLFLIYKFSESRFFPVVSLESHMLFEDNNFEKAINSSVLDLKGERYYSSHLDLFSDLDFLRDLRYKNLEAYLLSVKDYLDEYMLDSLDQCYWCYEKAYRNVYHLLGLFERLKLFVYFDDDSVSSALFSYLPVEFSSYELSFDKDFSFLDIDILGENYVLYNDGDNKIDISDYLNFAMPLLVDEDYNFDVEEQFIKVNSDDVFLESIDFDLVDDVDVLFFEDFSLYEESILEELNFRNFSYSDFSNEDYVKDNLYTDHYKSYAHVLAEVIEKDNTLSFELTPISVSNLEVNDFIFTVENDFEDVDLSIKVYDQNENILYEGYLNMIDSRVDISSVFDYVDFNGQIDEYGYFLPQEFLIDIVFDSSEEVVFKDFYYVIVNSFDDEIIDRFDYAVADGNGFDYEFLLSSNQEIMARYPFLRQGSDGKFYISGRVDLNDDFVLPRGYELIIEPGSQIYLAEGKTFLSYSKVIAEGNLNQPILFSSLGDEPFNSVGLVNENADGSKFEYVNFENGSESYINGLYLSGMLSVYNVDDVVVKNCSFKDAKADDALNFKDSNSSVYDSYFAYNSADAIDFDFMTGEIYGNIFEGNGNDSIDISGSKILIVNNQIYDSGDKGMSFGEKSFPFVFNNLIQGSYIGIEVKDLSRPLIVNNVIRNNEMGINAYQKKEIFGGGYANVFNTLLYGNAEDLTFKDTFKEKNLKSDDSTIEYLFSNVDREISDDVLSLELFKDLPEIYRFVLKNLYFNLKIGLLNELSYEK